MGNSYPKSGWQVFRGWWVVGEHCWGCVADEFVIANLLPKGDGFLPNERVIIVVFAQSSMSVRDSDPVTRHGPYALVTDVLAAYCLGKG